MLDIIILAIGKIKEKYWQEAIGEYTKRLQPYARLRVVELSAVSFSGANQQKAKEEEGRKILKFLEKKKEASIYLLAENGQTFDSIEFATYLKNTGPLILVLGGSLGFSEELYVKYPRVSLSKLTFPHELARVILLEQIYRSVTILNNKEYHH